MAGGVGLPAAASTAEIEDSLDLEAIVGHYVRQGGWILSDDFAEDFMLFDFEMVEEKDGKKG